MRRIRRVMVWVFLSYAVVLAVLTHWPRLTIRAPIDRPDLWIHAGVFAAWTVLLDLSGLVRFGRSRLGQLALLVIVAMGYAALDEWTQQFVGRHTAMDDLLADWIGIGLGILVLVVGLGVSSSIDRGRHGARGGPGVHPDPVDRPPPNPG